MRYYCSLAVVVVACLALTCDAFCRAPPALSLVRQTPPIKPESLSSSSLFASKRSSSKKSPPEKKPSKKSPSKKSPPKKSPSKETPSDKTSSKKNSVATFRRVSGEDEGIPIPFINEEGNSFIECYADSIITVDDVDYTIGVPCDYCVALCYNKGEELVPIEIDDELLNDVYPTAESIMSNEFGEELVLQRTPQTLTLIGELEEDEDDGNVEGEVEVLLIFEHRGKEFTLVRLFDPILIVAKPEPERDFVRLLLTKEESEKVMPILEQTFLDFRDDGNSMLP